MSFLWGRLPPMTRVADWNRLAPNGPIGSFRDAEIRKMLPNGLKTYKLQQEDELTAAQREQIVSMEPQKTDTATRSRYIEDMPLHMEVANGEKIVTKYDQEIIELEKAIKIVAEEIREMERKEAELFRKDVPDVDKEEVTKAFKVENGGNKQTKQKRKKKKKRKADKKRSKTKKEGTIKRKLHDDCRNADVDISDIYKKEKELDEQARKLVADALHAAVKLEAKLIVADVVKSAVQIAQADQEEQLMSAHASVFVENAIKCAVNAMKAKQKKDEMDAKAKEIADNAIRAAVNDMKDEKEKHEMDIRAKVIVDAALKGALKVMQIQMEKHEMDVRAKGIVDAATKGALEVTQIEKENNQMVVRAKVIVNAAIKGAAKVMQIEKENNEMDTRANRIVDAAIKGAVKVMQVEKEKNEMNTKAKQIVDAAIKGAVQVMTAEHAKAELATEIEPGMNDGNVLGAMLGQNGYDHHRIHVHVTPERFTVKERTDICQYWSEKLGIATTKNTKLHRDVAYFGRIVTRSDKDDADRSWSHTYGDVSCSFKSANDSGESIAETDVGDACPAIQNGEVSKNSKRLCIQEKDIQQAMEIEQNYSCFTNMDSDATNNHQQLGNDTVTTVGVNNMKPYTNKSTDNDMTDTCPGTNYDNTHGKEWIYTLKTNIKLDMQYEAPEIKHEAEDIDPYYSKSSTTDVLESCLMDHPHTGLPLSSPQEAPNIPLQCHHCGVVCRDSEHFTSHVQEHFTNSYCCCESRVSTTGPDEDIDRDDADRPLCKRCGMVSGGGLPPPTYKRRRVAYKSSSCMRTHKSHLEPYSNQTNKSIAAVVSNVVKRSHKGKAAVMSNYDKKHGKSKGVIVSGVAKKKIKSDTVSRVAKIKHKHEAVNVSEVYMDAGKGNDVAVSEHASEYPCQKCGKIYAKAGNLKRHVCIRTKDLHCKCPVCGTIVGNHNQLKRHILTHDGKRDHICSICQKSFTRRGDLNRHVRIHEGNEQYPCSECDKTFARKSSLKKHSISHSGVKSQQCDKCGATFGLKEILKQHVFHVHEGTRNFACDFCKKAFSTKSVLEQHIRTHTGERPYVCSYCGKSFTQPYQLTVHSRIHTEERPYQCTYCGKEFHCNSQLKIHVRIHSQKISKQK